MSPRSIRRRGEPSSRECGAATEETSANDLITHNANIPVLADADLVLVMNSDGRIGTVEKSGTCASPKLCTSAESMTWRRTCHGALFAMIP